MFLRDNIVGTVIIVSMIIWVPASCVFSYVDRRRQEDYKKYVEWYYSNELVHPGDKVRVIVSKRKRVHEPGTRSQEGVVGGNTRGIHDNGPNAGNRSQHDPGPGSRSQHDNNTRVHDTRDSSEGTENRQVLNTPQQGPPVSQHYSSAM